MAETAHASKAEVMVLVLDFLKRNHLEASYAAMATECKAKFDLCEPQEKLRDLHDILNEYLGLLRRRTDAGALARHETVGRQFRSKVAKTMDGLDRLLEDYMAVRQHLKGEEEADARVSSRMAGNKKVASLSEAVGSMSEQLKKRKKTYVPKAAAPRKHTPPASSSSSSSSKFATPSKSPHEDSLGLHNISFSGSVTPIELDPNMSRSRLMPLDDHDISLADLGNASSPPFAIDLENNNTNKSLLQCGDVSLGSILENTTSFLGAGARTNLSTFLADHSTGGGELNDSAAQPARATQRGKEGEDGLQTLKIETTPRASTKRKKRRITPTTIHAASPKRGGAGVAKIADVNSFLDRVHVRGEPAR